MGSYTPGAEAPFKYTKDSFIGVRDAWLSFALDRWSKAFAAFVQYKEKLPESVKSKLPKSKSEVPASTTTAAPLES
jgi:hypothetical protein